MRPNFAPDADAGDGKKRVRKQAVVIIHGIGEQRPMATMRSLVYTLLGERQYSKPDRMTGSHELRRLRALEPLDLGDRWLETDFYELYWAHEVRGTGLGSVLLWLVGLFFQPLKPGHVQRRRIRTMKVVASLLSVLLLVGAMMVWRFRADIMGFPLIGGLLIVAGIVGIPTILGIILKPVVDVVGDAARYLSPRPENVQARHNIRAAGLALLEQLHEDPYIDRVVVIGHSLGSIIGYDLLCAYWAAVHIDVPVPKRTLDEITRAGAVLAAARLEAAGLEAARLAAEGGGRSNGDMECQLELESGGQQARLRMAVETFHREQGQAFEECLAYARKDRAPGRGADPIRPWLISDFVTLGSPLAYVDFIRAGTPAGHERAVALWEAPTCPPEPKWDWDAAHGGYRKTRPHRTDEPGHHGNYGYKNSGDKRYRWHHAAVFAPTRWTNLYYPGDVFGQRLAPLFGPGIADVALLPAKGEPGVGARLPLQRIRWPWRLGSHVRYWHNKGRKPLDASAEWLREVVFRRAGAEAPMPDERPVRPVNRSSGRYDELPEHLRV